MTPSSNGHVRANPLRFLEELPGISDVVWATVTRLADARVPTTLLFTAAEKRAGTSVLASATALGLAQHQRVPVCLVETNVRRPALAGYLGLETVGLSDVLDGRVEMEDCLQEPADCPGLFVLTAGTPRAPVSGEFTTNRIASILARLEQRCRYVVLDTAPVLDHLESRLLLRQADAVVLVLHARSTRRRDAERAHDILVESGTPVLGSIFNDFRTEGPFGDIGSANRSFQRAVRAERPRASVDSGEAPAPPAELTLSSNGRSHSTNGGPVLEVPTLPAGDAESAHVRQIDVLERRIAKLTHLLEQTEANLQRIAALKGVDPGISSIYRDVQGLSSEDEALAFKRSLMRKIFQANLELKDAIARHA
jgi:Mrp family chromosome partitioning ATPase